MPFRQDVTKFTRGNHVATLLRILPEDAWQGLVRFELTGKIQWMNAAEMRHMGWMPRNHN